MNFIYNYSYFNVVNFRLFPEDLPTQLEIH